MSSTIVFLGFGALGGLARALLGILKNKKQKGVSYGKLLINILSGAVIGAVVGVLVDKTSIASLVSGYAGIDIIEGLIKVYKDKVI